MEEEEDDHDNIATNNTRHHLYYQRIQTRHSQTEQSSSNFNAAIKDYARRRRRPSIAECRKDHRFAPIQSDISRSNIKQDYVTTSTASGLCNRFRGVSTVSTWPTESISYSDWRLRDVDLIRSPVWCCY